MPEWLALGEVPCNNSGLYYMRYESCLGLHMPSLFATIVWQQCQCNPLIAAPAHANSRQHHGRRSAKTSKKA